MGETIIKPNVVKNGGEKTVSPQIQMKIAIGIYLALLMAAKSETDFYEICSLCKILLEPQYSNFQEFIPACQRLLDRVRFFPFSSLIFLPWNFPRVRNKNTNDAKGKLSVLKI